MEVPLVKRDRVVGALQLCGTVDSPPYTQDDLLLAQLLANRVAATLENRRLDEEQRSIARTLQASLLPARVPSIDGLDVAVRYWAAGEANIVGGDFYDVFALGDRWAFVIGDACGKGPQAASLTALARHTIRAAAWNGAEPGRVLRHLNHAIEQSDADTFCTVLYTHGHEVRHWLPTLPSPPAVTHCQSCIAARWTDGTHRCTRVSLSAHSTTWYGPLPAPTCPLATPSCCTPTASPTSAPSRAAFPSAIWQPFVRSSPLRGYVRSGRGSRAGLGEHIGARPCDSRIATTTSRLVVITVR